MKKVLSKVFIVVTILSLVFSFSACSNKENAANSVNKENKQGDNGESDSSKPKNLGSLRVAWFPATIKAALTSIAYKEGYFEDEGVTIKCETIQNSADALTALKLGKVDIVPTGITQPIKFISEGTEFVIFGGSAQEGGAIITKPENAENYKDLKNWKGKKWASGRNYTGDFIVRNSLRELGIIPGKDITITDVNDDTSIIQTVSKGLADIGYITADGVSRAKDMGLSVIIRVGDLVPYYPCCRQTASVKAIESNREAFVAYQRGLIRAYKLILTDKEKSIKVMEELTGQSRDYVETGLYGEFASRYNPSPARKKVAEYTKFLIQEGVVSNADFKIEEHVDSSIFKEALSDILEANPNDKEYQALKEFSDQND